MRVSWLADNLRTPHHSQGDDMASLELRGKTYSIVFRYGGRKITRSLKTRDIKEAQSRLSRLEENLRLVDAGRLTLPLQADVATFLLSDGKIEQKPVLRSLTLGAAFSQFFDAIPSKSLEKTTLDGMQIHRRHLERLLGEKRTLQTLALSDLQLYVNTRCDEPGQRGGTVGPNTINKELTTLRSLWHWAVNAGLLQGDLPRKGIRLPKGKERPPFQTWDEIETQTAGLDENEQKELWDCLYLRLSEIEELLKHVKKTANHPFTHPMFVAAAHTGARRSELLRSRLGDIYKDFIVIRERKRKHGHETTRRVPLSTTLRSVLDNWLKEHPGGPHTFCLAAGTPRSRNGKEIRPISRDAANDHFKRPLANSRWSVVRGWHCFRHSFISNLASSGVDQRLIDEFVGHTSEEVKRRYRHLLPDVKQQAIRSVLG